jgi:glycosyltransferase involved in cell wall biosynthesis
MRRKPSILVFCDYFDPAYLAGGPIRSLQNLINSELGREVQFYVITRDRDIGSSVPFPNVVTGKWLPYGRACVMYVGPRLSSVVSAIRLVQSTTYDVLYLNSLFSFWFSIITIIARWLGYVRGTRVVLAPRGELSKAALQIKARRKAFYLRTAAVLRLYDGIKWHASTELEAADIRSTFGRMSLVESVVPLGSSVGRAERKVVDVHTASDILHYPVVPLAQRTGTSTARLRVVFLSRICRMKNLQVGIDAVIRASEELDAEIEFCIYGPAEDRRYWEQCLEMIEANQSKAVITYRGPVRPDEITNVLSGYQVFILPTLGENFGHVIAEALAAGCIVLTSKHTPWSAIEEAGCGYCCSSNTSEEYAKSLVELYHATPEEIHRRCVVAQQFVVGRWDKAVEFERHRKLFGLTPDKSVMLGGGGDDMRRDL